MVKVVLKGFSDLTQSIFEILTEIDYIDLIAFTDNDASKWGQLYKGVPCISPFELRNKYVHKEFDYIVVNTIWDIKRGFDVYRELIELGINSDDIKFLPIEFCKSDTKILEFQSFYELNYLYYLEFHLTNRCNLNCSGCSHFVPLIPRGDDLEFSNIKKDLSQLKTKVKHINEIRIMGGEPLLSAKLMECIRYVKKLYPYTNIYVVTNGALVLRMSDEFWDCLKDNRVCLDVSCYPPLYDYYDDIVRMLKAKGVFYRLGVVKWGMRQCLKENGTLIHLEDVFDKCYCVNLYKGRLFTCPERAYVEYFNAFFNMRMPIDDGIDIYSDISFEEIRRKLYKPGKLCEYCNMWYMDIHDYKKFDVSGEKPDINSWYIKEL